MLETDYQNYLVNKWVVRDICTLEEMVVNIMTVRISYHLQVNINIKGKHHERNIGYIK